MDSDTKTEGSVPVSSLHVSSHALQELQARLGYTFANEDLLYQALTHRSTPKDSQLRLQGLSVWHNERLEFLGDAVLDLVVSSMLYDRFPQATEGALSNWRSFLVNTRSLSHLSEKIGLGSCLMMGRGEYLSGGREKISILGNCFEAILGALFLDGGLDCVHHVVTRLMGDMVEGLQDVDRHKDYKSLLQERLQGVNRSLPCYEVISVSGPHHDRLFEVSCLLEDDRMRGVGSGSSKRHAEQSAAKEVLDQLTQKSDRFEDDFRE